MNTTAKLAVGAATVVVALLGLNFLGPGGPSVGGEPEPTPIPSPTASPSLIPLTESVPLDAGRYSLGSQFPVGISFDLPSGWESCSLGVLEQGVCPVDGVGVGFLVIENVVADPCSGELLDPPVGPSIDDLATAVANLPRFDATPTEDATVDGFDARRLTITAPEDTGCDLSTWATPDRTNGVAPGEANLLYLVDVDGVRVMINAAYFPADVTDEDLAAAEAVIASIQIEP
jgi:hypothetical protein